jgi:hypothetical protein
MAGFVCFVNINVEYRVFIMLVVFCILMFRTAAINTIIVSRHVEFNLASNNESPVFVDLICKVNGCRQRSVRHTVIFR